MHADVARLVSDSGQLTAVTGLVSDGDRFAALAFQFASGVLHLRCDDDTDEIIVEVAEHHVDYPFVNHESLADLVGMTVEYAWTLTNHRGYADAFQLRLTNGHGRDETRQFEVGASAMDVHRVLG